MIIRVKVKTNSSEQGIEKVGEEYIVRLKSLPEDGKANMELIKLLSKYFDSEVRIKSGFTSKHKIVQVFD